MNIVVISKYDVFQPQKAQMFTATFSEIYINPPLAPLLIE